MVFSARLIAVQSLVGKPCTQHSSLSSVGHRGKWSLATQLFVLGLIGIGHLSNPLLAQAQSEGKLSSGAVYRPIPLQPGSLVKDSLSEKDIPTGKGSFARDYLIDLNKGDQIAIDLTSENFDTVVTLMTPNGTTMGENDDGPDGGTNSLLFMRIAQSGSYIVRVQAFGQAKGGPFTLKLTHLKPSGKS